MLLGGGIEVQATGLQGRVVGLVDRPLPAAHLLERLDRLASGNPGDAKQVGQGVWELRLMFGPGYRIYYLHDGPRVILLLCGGDKATQQRDIERAHQLADDYRNEEDKDHG